MIHNLYLSYLRNRVLVLGCLFSTLFLASLIIQSAILIAVLDQSRRNEDLLKGNACMLLIKPEERTRTNLRACIEKNRTKPDKKPFEFKTQEDIEKENIEFNVSPITSTVVRANKKTVPTTEKSSIKPPINTVEKTAPKILTKVDETGRKVWRYVGESLWKLCIEECPE